MSKQLTFRYAVRIFLCWGMFSIASPTAAGPNYWPKGVQLGMEFANPLYYKYYRKQITQQYEFNASIDFARLLLEGDYGWGSSQWGIHDPTTNQVSSGMNDGTYFRVGLNYNMLPATPARNAAFLGMRYARSFSDYTSTASWYEVVAGVKIKVWKILYAGSTLRYKFGLAPDKHLRSPHLLGWGMYRKGDDEILGITYYIALRIPFERYRSPQNNSPEK